MIKPSNKAFPLGILLAALVILTACGGGGTTPTLDDQQPADITAPRITSIDGICDGDVIQYSAVFGASATDDTGVANFKLRINGETVIDAALASIVYSWDVRKIEDGAYDLEFIASDAAGNAATQTVSVTVGENEQEIEPEPVVEIDTTPVFDEDYSLPPMDPALYNENDKFSPSLIITGITSEDVVWGTKRISVISSDDTGVNVITLLLDGKQLAFTEEVSLAYEWDTTYYTNGYHLLTIIVRDNGKGIFRCELHLTVDNESDFTGPVLDPISATTWSFKGMSGQLGQVHETWDGWRCQATGQVHFKVQAVDESAVSLMSLLIDGELAAASTGDSLMYLWNPLSDVQQGSFLITLNAEDEHGNQTSRNLEINVSNVCEIAGKVSSQNGVMVKDVDVMLYTGSYQSIGELAELQPLDEVQTDYRGYFSSAPVTSGRYTVLVKVAEYEVLVPVEAKLTAAYYIDEDLLVMPAMYGELEPNNNIAVVTGNADDIPAVFDTLSTAGIAVYTNNFDQPLVDNIDLIDGDNSLGTGSLDFLDFVADPALLDDYRFIMIESGNAFEQAWAGNPQLVANLRNWVSDGGQLILTNQSYDFLEQLLPQYIDFAGCDEIDGLGDTPETLNCAEVGPALAYSKVTRQDSDVWHWGYFEDRLINDLRKTPLDRPSAGWSVIAQASDAVHSWVTVDIDSTAEIHNTPVVVDLGFNLGRVVLFTMNVDQHGANETRVAAGLFDVLSFQR